MKAERKVSSKSALETADLDANRPFLEQFEELAEKDAKTSEWLEREVYPDRRIMLEWDLMTLMKIKG